MTLDCPLLSTLRKHTASLPIHPSVNSINPSKQLTAYHSFHYSHQDANRFANLHKLQNTKRSPPAFSIPFSADSPLDFRCDMQYAMHCTILNAPPLLWWTPGAMPATSKLALESAQTRQLQLDAAKPRYPYKLAGYLNRQLFLMNDRP